MCLCINSVTRGTNVTFEFKFGDGTQKIPSSVDESQTKTITQTHVYHDGERYGSSVVCLELFNLFSVHFFALTFLYATLHYITELFVVLYGIYYNYCTAAYYESQ